MMAHNIWNPHRQTRKTWISLDMVRLWLTHPIGFRRQKRHPVPAQALYEKEQQSVALQKSLAMAKAQWESESEVGRDPWTMS